MTKDELDAIRARDAVDREYGLDGIALRDRRALLAELERLLAIELKYTNLCAVLNEQQARLAEALDKIRVQGEQYMEMYQLNSDARTRLAEAERLLTRAMSQSARVHGDFMGQIQTFLARKNRCVHGVWAADHCYQCAADSADEGAK